MKQITCPHCGDTYPDFDVAHVCSKGPYAPRLKPKMNERIRELAGQAGLTFVNAITDDNEDIECVADTNGGLPCSTELEKFAELIVRECVAICQDIDGEDNIDARSGRQDCAVEIKEHFGVEE